MKRIIKVTDLNIPNELHKFHKIENKNSAGIQRSKKQYKRKPKHRRNYNEM